MLLYEGRLTTYYSDYFLKGRELFFNSLNPKATKEDLVAEIITNGLVMTAITKFVAFKVRVSNFIQKKKKTHNNAH